MKINKFTVIILFFCILIISQNSSAQNSGVTTNQDYVDKVFSTSDEILESDNEMSTTEEPSTLIEPETIKKLDIQAIVNLKNINDSLITQGMLTINDLRGRAIAINGLIKNLGPNSKYAIRFHEKGNCSDGSYSVGNLFEIDSSDAEIALNSGDGILTSAAGAKPVLMVLPGYGLEGDKSVIGRSLVLYEYFDNPELPENGLGQMIACGKVEKLK